MRKTFYAGLDVGSTVCELVVLSEGKKRVYARKFPTSERNLIATVQECRKELRGELHLALEEGEMAQWIAGALRPEVTRLVVCDPKRNAWIARDANKNDRVDADKLAQLLMGDFLREVYHPEDEDRAEFKRVVQNYHDLTATQAGLKCQIKSRFRAHGIMVSGQPVFSPEGRQKALTLLPSAPSREILKQFYGLLDAAVKVQAEGRRLMVAVGRKFSEVKRFQDVPGIGPVLACTFSAYIQTPARFKSKRRLWKYCRLGITDRQSNGEPLGRKRLDRNGVGLLKRLSYAAFCASKKGDNEFRKHFEESLHRTKDRTHARLNTQRKILAVLYGMWKRNEPYQPFRSQQEQPRKEEKQSSSNRA